MLGHLPRQFAKEPLGTIPSHSKPKPLPYNDPDTGVRSIYLANQQVEECRRQPAPMLLDIIDVTTGTEEPFILPMSDSCHAGTPHAMPAQDVPVYKAERDRTEPCWMETSRMKGTNGGQRVLAMLGGILVGFFGYTVNLARPLARRRASTLRPFFVDMRLRNPCSRFFFKFDGC